MPVVERTERDIINKYLEYKDRPEIIDGITDMLVFLGMFEALDFHTEALKEIEAEKEATKQYRKDYARHIGASFKNYMPFNKYVELRESGELK